MLIYWLLFAIFAVGAFRETAHGASRLARPGILFSFALAFVVGLVGLRFQVGGDWKAYEFMFFFVQYVDFVDVLERGDPAYQALNWVTQRMGLGIWAVNLVCALLFVWGLGRLARTQPSPWLSVLVAVPYLVLVVAMGYSRQAVAIGLIMAGMAALANGASLLRFAVYVAVAALFHKTAIVVLPLLILSSERNRLLNIIGGLAASLFLYDVFLADDVDQLLKSYVVAEYNSQGAAIRVAMNLVPAIATLIYGRRLGFSQTELRIWRAFSWTSVGLLILLIVSPSSTAVDRIALYMIPLQIVILPRLITLFQSVQFGKMIVIVYAGAIQFTWLSFAVHSQYWIPYQFYPTADEQFDRGH